MKLIGLSLRVDIHQYQTSSERRDSYDQCWVDFFHVCGFTPVLLPNNLQVVKELLKSIDVAGIVLSGGNSPVGYNGNAPERDEVEEFLVHWSEDNNNPLIGVCRGMQSIQLAYDQKLQSVENHVQEQLEIIVNGRPRVVNSYHELGSKQVSTPLITRGLSKDGVIKAIAHERANIHGIMWHPERNNSFDHLDIDFFKQVFSL